MNMGSIRLICRMCLQCNDLVNIFSENVKNSGLFKMINSYLGQDVTEKDDLPDFICLACIKIICDFDVYCKRTAENQEYLKKNFTVVRSGDSKELVFVRKTTFKRQLEGTPNPLSVNFPIQDSVHELKKKKLPKGKIEPPEDLPPMCLMEEIRFPMDDLGAEVSYSSENFEAEEVPDNCEQDVNDSTDEGDEPRIETVVSGIENLNKIFHNYCKSELEPDEPDRNIPEHMKSIINNYPTILVKDGRVVVRPWRLHDMLQIFYILKCDICPEGKASRLTFKTIKGFFSHYRKRHGTEGYVTCCDQKFSTQSEITYHMVWHLQPSAFRCSICGKKVSKPSTLIAHMKCHTRKKDEQTEPLRCDECGIRIKSKHFLEIHKLKIHSDYGEGYPERDINEPNPHYPGFPKSIMKNGEVAFRGEQMTILLNKFYTFTCEMCTEFESFPSFNVLTDHYQNVHSTRGYAMCCGLKFKTRTYLIYHMACHLDPDAFTCRYCGKICEKPGKLRDHLMLHKSEEERSYFCTQCPRRYTTHAALEKHMVSHISKEQRRKYPCKMCGRIFYSASTLYSHLKSKHDNRQHICDVCGKTYKNIYLFKSHVRRHDPDYVPKTYKKLKSIDERKRRKILSRTCPYCSLEFVTRKGIVEHVENYHEDKDLHKCSQCHYSNVKFELYLRHMAEAHLLDRSYVCKICGAHFEYKSKLNYHMNRHTREKIYRCQFCGKEYITTSGFCRHGRECHSEEYKQLKDQKRRMKKLKKEAHEGEVDETVMAAATIVDSNFSEEYEQFEDQTTEVITLEEDPPEEEVEENTNVINAEDFNFTFLLATDE